MNYKLLGRSGLAVSPVCLGTMMFGGRSDDSTAARIVGSAQDAGINFIDTADVYNDGKSERVVGRLIRKQRDHWVLATKGGNAMGPGPNERGLGRRWLMRAVEGSLGRLGTDVIDIYYLHRDDHAVDLAETVMALGDLIRAGKIRHWGVSNFRAYRMTHMVALADRLGVPHPVVSQPYYNAMNRMPEVEVLPACAEHGIGVVPYSPLARGVLTGKYDPDAKPKKGTRAGLGDVRMMETEFRRESLVMAQTIKAHAESRGMTAGQFALNWVLNNRIVTSVLAGPRTMAQWKEYLGGLAHDFTAEDEALIDELLAGEKTVFKDWEENTPYFEGCLPIEVMAERGRQTLAFGPMKPVGLTNPHAPDVKPHAVVQLRQDNALGTLYNMVGFQTKLTYGEQKRVFRTIPGLENAEFARLGGLHRNTFINSPKLLDATLRLKAMPRLRFAGQITGCEGYVESAAMGLMAGRFAAAERLGESPAAPPPTTAHGALLGHVTGGAEAETFQPMNINFGLFPPIDLRNKKGRRIKGRARKQAMAHRALADLRDWLG